MEDKLLILVAKLTREFPGVDVDNIIKATKALAGVEETPGQICEKAAEPAGSEPQESGQVVVEAKPEAKTEVKPEAKPEAEPEDNKLKVARAGRSTSSTIRSLSGVADLFGCPAAIASAWLKEYGIEPIKCVKASHGLVALYSLDQLSQAAEEHGEPSERWPLGKLARTKDILKITGLECSQLYRHLSRLGIKAQHRTSGKTLSHYRYLVADIEAMLADPEWIGAQSHKAAVSSPSATTGTVAAATPSAPAPANQSVEREQ